MASIADIQKLLDVKTTSITKAVETKLGVIQEDVKTVKEDVKTVKGVVQKHDERLDALESEVKKLKDGSSPSGSNESFTPAKVILKNFSEYI